MTNYFRITAYHPEKNISVIMDSYGMFELEQGIVTEQTKIRLKELEAQIAGLDFDIGQEKQRNYTYLSPESVEKYLNSIICGDIQEMPVRKLIVKAFVREVILDNDNVTITYNFTENYTKYRVTQEIIQKVQRQSRKKTAYNKNLCSYKLPPLPPNKKNTARCSFFVSWDSNGSSVNDLPAAGHSNLPRARRREEPSFFPQKMSHAVCGFFVVFYLLNCAKTH